MQLSFDKNRIVKEKPKIAMSIKLAKHYIDKWCRKTPFDDFPIIAGAKKVDKIFLRNSLLGTALLTYAISALRAGNVLYGSSPNNEDQCIHIEDIFLQRQNKNSPLVFVINNRSKTSKVPIMTPIPFNPTGNKSLCAASRLLQLAQHRRHVDNAKETDFLFINPRNGKPLSTKVFNNEIKNLAKRVCLKQKLPLDLAKLYSAKSLRKLVSSEMKDENCTPQQVAEQLGHSTLDAQLNYMCNDYSKRKPFVEQLYGRLNM